MESTLTRDDRGVATYTIDDVATRNALSTKVLEDIERTLISLKQDPTVRVIVFTGAGKVFSSGADRAELGDPSTIETTTRLLSSVLTLIDESAVPVVCRVNGAAFGAGLAIVAAADISIAVSDSFFALPEVRFALVAGPAAAACLGRIGQAAALDVLLTGRRFDAAEALEMHLLARIVEREDLDTAVSAPIAELLLGDDAAIAMTRQVVRQLSSPTLADRLRAVRAASDVTEHHDTGYTRRGFSDGVAQDVDWRDVPARPRHALPASEVHPDLRGELPPLGRCVVAVGTFDGMHRGHVELISHVVERARLLGLPCVVLALDPNPAELIRPGSHPAALTTIARRAELALATGVDHFRVLPFDLNVANLEPIEFVRQVLVERLHVAHVVSGENFHFGHLASGSTQQMSELAARFGFVSETVDLVRDVDTVISSTYIRSCVEAGDVAVAGSALGRPHRLDGVIEHGDHRGRQLGFPTANLSFDRFAAVPADGVYAGRAVYLDEWGQTSDSASLGPAAISVGTNPTFDGRQRRVEAHILDLDIDLYGRRVGLEFHRLLRGMVRFDSIEPLIAQMRTDVAQTRVAPGEAVRS